tara:strand:- start:92 stop:367 length:276 start_codon:yes stop_codon:yes gene_type:complete
MKKKNWSIEDDIYVIDTIMNKYKSHEWGDIIKSIAKEIEAPQNSVKMRIKNYVAILTDGESGFGNYAKDSKKAIDLSLKKHTIGQLLRAFE